MYAFPTPGQSGHLALVLNVVPYADPSSFFSDTEPASCNRRLISVPAAKKHPGGGNLKARSLCAASAGRHPVDGLSGTAQAIWTAGPADTGTRRS
jgi:hypothetical protein